MTGFARSGLGCRGKWALEEIEFERGNELDVGRYRLLSPSVKVGGGLQCGRLSMGEPHNDIVAEVRSFGTVKWFRDSGNLDHWVRRLYQECPGLREWGGTLSQGSQLD